MNMSSAEEAMKEEIKFEEYLAFTRSIKYCMLLCGIWPTGQPGILDRVLSILAITSTSTLSIVLLRFAFANITNISLMVRGFSLGTSYLSLALKVILLTFHKKTVSELYTILHKYHEEALADKKLRSRVLEKITGFRRLSWIQTCLVISGSLMYSFMPIIFMIIQLRQHMQPIKYILPLPALYPWKIQPGGLLYKITYLFEMYNMLCMTTITCGVDPLFGYFIFLITGQLRVLSYEMINIKPSDNHEEFIRQWMTKFQVLKDCCRKVQKIYGPIILWQVTTNAAVICTILFQISQGKGISVAKYVLILCYSGGKIVQTFIYSWAGTVLTNESEALTESVYFSDWPEAERQRFRAIVLIILTQKPLKISAANWIVVSNDLFVMTLNTAVSYFFLLKTVEEKQS